MFGRDVPTSVENLTCSDNPMELIGFDGKCINDDHQFSGGLRIECLRCPNLVVENALFADSWVERAVLDSACAEALRRDGGERLLKEYRFWEFPEATRIERRNSSDPA